MKTFVTSSSVKIARKPDDATFIKVSDLFNYIQITTSRIKQTDWNLYM